jgi:alkanesulfonate monooxygenase SsuD/methylene tetrahydromethanopterin reductase-like flavin-dependent oxidoreductase (luciferase family)
MKSEWNPIPASPASRSRPLRTQEARAAEIVAREAALFISREAGSESLITVVRAQSVAHGDRIMVFVSVFPVEKSRAALAFLERQRQAFSDHLKKHAHLRLPRIDFMLDNGETPLSDTATR